MRPNPLLAHEQKKRSKSATRKKACSETDPARFLSSILEGGNEAASQASSADQQNRTTDTAGIARTCSLPHPGDAACLTKEDDLLLEDMFGIFADDLSPKSDEVVEAHDSERGAPSYDSSSRKKEQNSEHVDACDQVEEACTERSQFPGLQFQESQQQERSERRDVLHAYDAIKSEPAEQKPIALPPSHPTGHHIAESGSRCSETLFEQQVWAGSRQDQLRERQKMASGFEQEDVCSRSVKLHDICLEYPFECLQTATLGFSKSRRLGSGSAGTVYRGEMSDGSEIAVKALDTSSEIQSPVSKGFCEEITTLSKFRHPNLVMLMGWSHAGSQGFLVYEFLSGGDLQQKLKSSSVFRWKERLRAALDAATGMAHLHTMRPQAFHRDVKSANILLTSEGMAKMADFGLSCMAREVSSTAIRCKLPSGTAGYACPRYIESGDIAERSEVYSFGMVLLELLLNCSPAEFVDGKMTYPIQAFVSPAGPGSLQRCLDRCDSRACWPSTAARDTARLALRCIEEEQAERPVFVDICREMRQLVKEPLDAKPQEQDTVQVGNLPPPFVLRVTGPGSHVQDLGASCSAPAALHVGLSFQPTSFWESALLAASLKSEIRDEHFVISLEDDRSFRLRNFSDAGVLVNESVVKDEVRLQPGDCISIQRRSHSGQASEALVTFCLRSTAILGITDVFEDRRASEPVLEEGEQTGLHLKTQCGTSTVCTVS
eukprot:TRINITY_DN13188_c0_g1_i1.p1 TRINITY_DN13188_c0_g1~~TRINITY_DN13188_c0_g1_i1.p1  ORF type:complete len:717 (+),score=142.84 TRINITY_DN13188_c0_g1_i1:230-2380(+)